MNELRWILLVAGLLLLAGIYAFGMRSRQRTAPPLERSARVDAPPPPAAESPRVEPSLSSHSAFDSTSTVTEHTIDFDEPAFTRAPAGRREPTLGTEAPLVVQRPAPEDLPEPMLEPARAEAPAPEPEPAAAPEARPQQKIVALRVVANPPLRFEGARLLEVIQSEELQFGRYEIFHNLHADGRPIFSLASLREPGTFDLGSMPGSNFPGIALFAVLPGPLPAVETFDQLIFTARAFAAQLGGTLADDRGAPLTVHRITRLREEMVAFDRQHADGAAD